MPPRTRSLLLAVAALVALAVPAQADAAGKHKVRVMTRNVYLGASLTPGLEARTFPELVNAAGVILNEVDRNRFQVRARGLAAEILRKKPDLVGLQEAALWRTAPCRIIVPPSPPTARTVRYDYLKLLLRRLNRGKRRYRLAVSQPEFDFETEANTDGSADNSCDTNARLTMRDAILVRVRAGVRLARRRKGHFKTLLAPKLIGAVTVPVVRGWTSVDARVRGSRRFRFVNTHLEAFDSRASNPTSDGRTVGNGEVREAQARELVRRGGPATGRPPVILLGDLNSDRRTEVRPGDARAYNALIRSGFRQRSTYRPLSCCLETSLLAAPGGGGRLSDLDHKVDHVLTDAPRRIRRLSSSVTGRRPRNGFWNSDHAGVFSSLSIP